MHRLLGSPRRSCGALLALLWLLAAPGARAAGRNLLVNPGFEDPLAGHPWMPAGWDTSRAGTEAVLFTRDDYSKHEGSFGVGVANASTSLPLWHNWSQTIAVTPDMWGKDLVFSVWSKNNGLEGRGYVLLQAFRDTVGVLARKWGLPRGAAGRRGGFPGVNDPIVDLAWDRASFAERETDWIQRDLRVFLPPTTNLITVRIGLYGIGQVLFDDASLTLEPAKPAVAPPLHTNLLADPGFEAGGLGWELSIPPFPMYTAGPDTVHPHSGTYCMHFNQEHGMVAGRAGVSQVFCNRALSGKRVRFSAYGRSDTLRSQILLHLYCHTRTGVTQVPSVGRVSTTSDWTPLAVECDVPRDTYSVWAHIEYTAPVAGHAYFDDASFEVLGPATGAPTPGAESSAAPDVGPHGSPAKGAKPSGSRQ